MNGIGLNISLTAPHIINLDFMDFVIILVAQPPPCFNSWLSKLPGVPLATVCSRQHSPRHRKGVEN